MQDPLADGPVIQGAATRALEKGTTLDKVIDVVRKVSPTMKAPIVMFCYYNPIMRKGLDNFCRTVKEAGASGEAPITPPTHPPAEHGSQHQLHQLMQRNHRGPHACRAAMLPGLASIRIQAAIGRLDDQVDAAPASSL